MKLPRTKWRSKGTLDKCLIFCAFLISITLIYAMVVFALKGTEPSSLLDYVKTICGAEGFLTAAIAIYKIKKGKDDGNDKD